MGGHVQPLGTALLYMALQFAVPQHSFSLPVPWPFEVVRTFWAFRLWAVPEVDGHLLKSWRTPALQVRCDFIGECLSLFDSACLNIWRWSYCTASCQWAFAALRILTTYAIMP